MAAWRTRDIVIPDIQDPAKSSLDLKCPLPVDSKPPEMGASNSVVAQARQRVDEHRLLRAMAEQPAPWPYCCRLGTCDRKGTSDAS
eukprot:COSAG03_NODE_1085_length_4856_cov_3.198444_4_plen_86_part_00